MEHSKAHKREHPADGAEIKIAVIGDPGTVLGFQGAGIDGFVQDNGGSLGARIDDLLDRGYGILFVTEELLAGSPETAKRNRETVLPAVIPIPGRNGSLGIGMGQIRENIERAVGADLWKEA